MNSGFPPARRSKAARQAFTLIELLVVVTIIVVLLALLTPALDRAVYDAELTTCGTRLKGVATGLAAGAVERNRHYPLRTALFDPLGVNRVNFPDERPELRRYLGAPLNGLLNCPLTQSVGIDAATPAATVRVSYNLWYGWSTGPSDKSMRRLGDRWTFEGQPYGVLAGDYEFYASENSSLYTNHPDGDRRMISSVVDDPASNVVSSWTKVGAERGELDLNAAFEDSSVRRYGDVAPHVLPGSDSRFDDVPLGWQAGVAIPRWSRVPRD